ncbi:pseudouridine synthase [Sphingopyxis sp. MWB1]|uniref:pseudouridine synthase n=1 Tax=Sphingopyxis sp. MWB1 TaxID=1537715 RepID=UPI00051A5E47|nr:pseudouridine synthase [Sphingopyxis sp. MWB1]
MTNRRPPSSRPSSIAATEGRGSRRPRRPLPGDGPSQDKAAPPIENEGPQRIPKLLARAGIGSRRDVERMIEEGRIALHGEIVRQPAPLLSSLDGLTVDGQPVAKPVSTRLYRFHKPAGCLTAARDPKGRKTIYDVLPKDLPRLMPVGRLDYNTEGLLLLTNDGEFKRQLELPASGVERTYRARAFGDISQSQLEDLVEGVEIDRVRYGKIDANLERRTGRNQWIELTLTEGKNREVRRVLEHLGLQVSRLIRTRYGEFDLQDLDMGAVEIVPRDALFQFRRRMAK